MRRDDTRAFPLVTMNLDDIKQILELVREHELAEFELERDGLKVRIRKAGAVAPVAYTTVAAPAAPVSGPVAAPGPAPVADTGEKDAPEGVDLAIIKSPIVGTLYRASEPGAPPFAQVGTLVKRGQVLCTRRGDAARRIDHGTKALAGSRARHMLGNVQLGLPVRAGRARGR